MYNYKQNKSLSAQKEADNIIDPSSNRTDIRWIMLIYFLSGACSLIDEVVWVRLLKLTLGNTVYASSIVVSVFMGGLALGAFIMSRYSDRINRRLRLYALLETLVTISAFAIPLALRATDKIYVWFFRSYHPDNSLILIVQVIFSGVILLVPSIIMGSTLPLLGRFVTAFEKEAGHLVGKLYAFNTLGAAVGCLLAGFILIRSYGVMGTLYIAAELNLLVAFGGWYLSRKHDNINSGKLEKKNFTISRQEVGNNTDRRFYILVIAFFMSGFISIGYELLWMRSIVHLLSGFTYVFSSVLTIYLLGNVIGTSIGSGLVKTLKEPALGFTVTLFILGLCGIFYIPFMTLWSSKLMPEIDRQIELTSHAIPFSTFLIMPLIQSAFLFLLPSIMMGIGFPIALQTWTNHVHKVGRSTGTAYTANTVGAVLGGIIVGFVLIPQTGLQLSITILGLAGIWIAGILSVLFVQSSNKFSRFGLIAAAGMLTIIASAIPTNLFKTVIAGNPGLPKQFKLLDIKEGTTTTVSLYKNTEDDALHLFSSGQSIAGDNYCLRGDQKMLGHFGILLNKHAKKTLSIGFGSGESTACLALHNLQRADCAEIAPEVVQLSLKHFSHINLGNRLDDKINMIYMDAKNYIHLTDIKYDAIINDSINPRSFADNASLYTKEYFESAYEHLNQNGLFLTWLPVGDGVTTEVFQSIVGTFMEVFPYVTIWCMTPEPAYYFLVVGSRQPQYFSLNHMETELAKEKVAESLSLVNINNSMDIMSCYIGDNEDLKQKIKNFELNSDYWPFVEFSTDYKQSYDYVFGKFVQDVRSDSIYHHIDWEGFSNEQKQKWISQFEKIYDASTFLLMTKCTDNLLQQIKYCKEGLSIVPDNPALLNAMYKLEHVLLSRSLDFISENVPQAAMTISDEMLKINQESAIGWLIKSAALEKTGDLKQAYQAIRKALYINPYNPDVHTQMGNIMMTVSEYDQAIKEFSEALRLGKKDRYFISKKHIQVLNALAEAYSSSGNIPRSIEASQTASKLIKSDGRVKIISEIKNPIDSFNLNN